MKLRFDATKIPEGVSEQNWLDWHWQMRTSERQAQEILSNLPPTELDRHHLAAKAFQFRVTPYYAVVAAKEPLRRIFMPDFKELLPGAQSELDPLGERQNSPTKRIIHRYPDRVLFLVTDVCSVYCRYCTRKHFTGQDEGRSTPEEYTAALSYIRLHPGIREVILSGGDPLTLSDQHLDQILFDLRKIDHVEIIRIGTRMPIVCPMRVSPDLACLIRAKKPVYLMTHFNHPRELTAEAALALETFVDHGVPVFNQMVLLNGVNNHVNIVQALSRRLLYLRVKPYYSFQCDPSQGTDHLRTTIDETKNIQREMWGVFSGLATPTFSLDIPNGGGKLTIVPGSNPIANETLTGWDGTRGVYIDPTDPRILPADWQDYEDEWQQTRAAKDRTRGTKPVEGERTWRQISLSSDPQTEC